MENRTRNKQLIIRLTDEEKELFNAKMKQAKCRNMNQFVRKCVLEKEIYHVDLEPFRKLHEQFSNATSNINQIAKRVNSTGVIYREDIQDIKLQLEAFSKKLIQIYSLLLNRTTNTEGN